MESETIKDWPIDRVWLKKQLVKDKYSIKRPKQTAGQISWCDERTKRVKIEDKNRVSI